MYIAVNFAAIYKDKGLLTYDSSVEKLVCRQFHWGD